MSLPDLKVFTPYGQEEKLADPRPPAWPPMTPWAEKKLPRVLISDIDQTIAFLPVDALGQPTRTFNDFAKSEGDVLNQKVAGLIKAWYSLSVDPTIYFVTNRDVRWRDVTLRWLTKNFSPVTYSWVLRMRPSNNLFSSAARVKEHHLVDEIMSRYNVKQVWEDDPDCIAMYQSHGLLVFDAKETW